MKLDTFIGIILQGRILLLGDVIEYHYLLCMGIQEVYYLLEHHLKMV